MMLFSMGLFFSTKQQERLHKHLKMCESCQVVRVTQNLNLLEEKRGKNLQNEKIKTTLEISLYYHNICFISTDLTEIPS